MKKLAKIVSGIVIGLFLILLVLPIVFKGKINSIVKEQINNNVKAKVNYADISLSFIKQFPNISFSINDLQVVGVDAFENDTLLSLGEFSTQLNLFKAISGDIVVNSILINDLDVNAMVNADSLANWDIAKATEAEEEAANTDDEGSSFSIVLESFKMNNTNISYADATAGIKSEIKGLNLDLSGDMSEVLTNLQLESVIGKLFVSYEETMYVNGASLGLSAGIRADMDNMIFSFLENELKINRMGLKLDGSVQMKEEGYGLDLTFGTIDTDFKNLLALVPEQYLSDYEGLQTEGDILFEGYVKGYYLDEEHLPAFDVKMKVNNGMVKFPELPESISNINVSLNVSNEGGSADNTISQLEQFHFELADNPFDASLLVTNPVSNPAFKGQVDGAIDLNSLVNAIPLDSFDIKGLVEAQFVVDGDYAMVEKEDYERINASGFINLSNFAFTSQDLPQGMLIRESNMVFNPKTVELRSFDCTIGRSDFDLKGKLENYLSYALKDGVLKGQLSHHSKLINTNEFLAYNSSETAETPESEEEMVLFEVPKNLDLLLQSRINKLVYDKLIINNTQGKITIANGVVKLNGLQMNLLDGNLTMTGQYNTANIKKPFVDFSFEGAELDLNMAANSFSVVDTLLPIAKNTKGRVSPKFKYNSLLGADAKPVMSSMNGGGWLRSKQVEVSDSKIQNSLAATFKSDSYKTMRAEDLNINFILDKGNVIVKPFKTKVGGKMVEIQGTQGLDQSIDYKITMPVSRKEVAKIAGSFGFALPTSGDDLVVDVLVKGSVQEPKLGFDLDKARKQIEKDLKKEGENLLKNLLKGF